MPGDVVLSRELKSLQEEISASPKERVVASTAASPAPPSAVEPAEETPDAGELRDQLRELASEVSGFFEEAEKGISAHPTQSVVGALLVGILIGRLLGRH
jgi:ElaB/YqjD/DUF883 family membrane-anchored ribosome-binding protein